MADQTYNSDTVKNGNPYKKKSHSYDVVELMHATTFERTVDDLGQTQWIFSDGGRTSLHPRIHQKYDYNMALKLPDEIRNAAPQHHQECAIDLFYEWKRPIGKQTQDTLKVTDLQIHKDYQPGPIAQRLLDERAERHPELFDSAGNPSQEEPFHAEPLTNPNPPSAEQRAEMLRTAQESMARIAEDAKTPDTSAIATTSIAPPADAKPSDNSTAKTEGSELDKVFGKREKRPVVNPGNWTHNTSTRNGFYAELQAKGWNKYGIPGPEKSKHIHAALGVNSLHETNLSPDVALVAVLVYLDKLFGKKDDNVTAPETTEITKDQWQAWLNDHNWNKKPFVLTALNAYSIEHGEGPVTKLGEWGFELDVATDAVNAFLDDVASREEKAPPQGESEAQGATEPLKQEAPAQPPVVSDKSSSANSSDKDEIRRRYNKPQRGNDYLVVQGRVLLFRIDHPSWGIETDAVMLTENTAVYKASIRNSEGVVIATGHGRATESGTKNLGGRYVEKAETSAIGRALALAGYGTDDSLDDSDYLADSPKSAA